MNTQINKKSKQGGFTLVEIAIVLVIIGLILGGVLQGQTMIENAKYKKFVKEIDGYRAAYYTFQDTYQGLPGDLDDNSALDAAAVEGNGGGTIASGYCDTTGEEACVVWSHLRYAQLIPGDPTDTTATASPSHAYGGDVDSMTYTTLGDAVAKNKLILLLVPGDVARRYDNEYDDGDPSDGNASVSGAAFTTANMTMVIKL